MKLTYYIEKKDALSFYMFDANNQGQLTKKMLSTGISWFLLMLVMGFAGTSKYRQGDFVYFIPIAILIAIMAAYSYKRSVTKAYNTLYDENQQLPSNEINASVEIMDAGISINSINTKIEFTFSAINKIYEVKDYFFMKYYVGLAVIIPKAKIPDPDLLKARLKEIASITQAPYIEKINWAY